MRKAFQVLSALIVLTLGCQLAGNAAKDPRPSFDLSKQNLNIIDDTQIGVFTEQLQDKGFREEPPIGTRNEYLRRSSKKTFSDKKGDPGWETHVLFYDNPSLNSIIAKYKKSDFAGCMQECEAYVSAKPNDTLGYYYLAMCYTKVNDKKNAIRAYEKVISLNDNPMIVKYATNGRNCILGNGETCFQNVNEPEYIYPYREIARGMELTPVDPQTLVDRNLKVLRDQMKTNADKQSDKNTKDGRFGSVQDEELDKFIEAPYGTGLSPNLQQEYTIQQLKKLQETINNGDNSLQDNINDINIIKDFDNQKSDSEEIKLAYTNEDIEALSKDPQYVQAQKEMNELRLLLGNDKSEVSNDFTDMIPYMSEKSRNLPPEVIQAMLLKSNSDMADFNFLNEKSF